MLIYERYIISLKLLNPISKGIHDSAHKDGTSREQPPPPRSEGTPPSKGGECVISAVQNEHVPVRLCWVETQPFDKLRMTFASLRTGGLKEVLWKAYSLLSFTFLFFTINTHAQERLTLQDAVARSLKYNFDIKIADLAVQQAQRNNTLGNAGFSPYVFLNATVSENLNDVHSQLASGGEQNNPRARATSINPYLQINWTIFDGGKMFIVKKQLNEYEAISASQLKLQVQTVVSRTIQIYAKVVWQQKQLIAVDTGLALARVRMDIANLKYETGAGAKIDYLQARVDYNARQSDSMTFISQLMQANDSLASIMGEQDDKNYITDDSLELNTGLEPIDKDKLQDVNLSLDVFKRNAYLSHLNADIANTAFLPTLTLGTGYNYVRNTNSTGFSVFTRSYGPTGSLTLSMPLFEGGNIRRVSKVASLQAMRDDLIFERQNTVLGKQYRTAWINYRVAVASYKLETENIKYAKENLDVQLARFRVGVGTTLESRQAETDYVTALERLYTAAYNLKVNETLVLELQNQLVK